MSTASTPCPSWLRSALPISKADEARLAPLLRSWVFLNANFHRFTELDLLKAALIEARTKKRHLIIHRCITRFRTMRNERENKELTPWLPPCTVAIDA